MSDDLVADVASATHHGDGDYFVRPPSTRVLGDRDGRVVAAVMVSVSLV